MIKPPSDAGYVQMRDAYLETNAGHYNNAALFVATRLIKHQTWQPNQTKQNQTSKNDWKVIRHIRWIVELF